MTNDQSVMEAADRLEAALSDERGELLPIDRIEFEIFAGLFAGRVRWTLWQGSHRLQSLIDDGRDVSGFLAASEAIIQTRMAQRAGKEPDRGTTSERN